MPPQQALEFIYFLLNVHGNGWRWMQSKINYSKKKVVDGVFEFALIYKRYDSYGDIRFVSNIFD